MVSDMKVGIKYPGKDLEKSVPNPGTPKWHVVEHGKIDNRVRQITKDSIFAEVAQSYLVHTLVIARLEISQLSNRTFLVA